MKLILLLLALSGCATMATSTNSIAWCNQRCHQIGLDMWQYKDATCQCQGNKIVPMTYQQR
jgi:uncharacterized protein YceK